MKTSSLFLFLLFSVMGAFAGPTEDMFDAIKNGNFDKFKAAIAAGADVNAHNAIGNTPLMDALTDINMVKELIAAKADVNKYNAGKTHNPLSIACTFAMNEAALALLDAGANVNLADAVMHPAWLGHSGRC